MIRGNFLIAGAIFSVACFGQSQAEHPQAEHPQFDAASVRVNQSADRPSTQYNAARVELNKASIKHMVRRGYPLPDIQLVLPDFAAGDRFNFGYDVSVTFPAGTSDDRLQLMFQDLLAKRFGMKAHWETREIRAFEVRPSEKGLKLKEAANPAPATDFPKYAARTTNGIWHLSSQLGGAASGLTVSGLIEALNSMNILDRPLVDATEIKGSYDIELSAPAEVPGNRPGVTDLLGALEKQVGLKATLKTIPLKVLVIDHLDRIPTEN